jgi:formylmethanofuran dehydrogenase subunit E
MVLVYNVLMPDFHLPYIVEDLQEVLQKSASLHDHLCPRQVLGVRLGLAGAYGLGLTLPRCDKRLLVILETDGCFADGVEAVTACSVGHRTLRIHDYGKVALIVVDVQTGAGLRVTPHPGARSRAEAYSRQAVPDEGRPYYQMLYGYQLMPETELAMIQTVRLLTPVEAIVSHPSARAVCQACGEEIFNDRQVLRDGQVFCRACAGDAYYTVEDSK